MAPYRAPLTSSNISIFVQRHGAVPRRVFFIWCALPTAALVTYNSSTMARSAAVTESQLMEQLKREGLHPTRWANDPHAIYGMHDHPYGKVLVVASGQITFTFTAARRAIAMNAGDRLEIPAGTSHSAVVGPDGVVCLEAHIP